MSRDTETALGPRGQIASRLLLESRPKVEPGPVKLAEDLYCLMGINICNSQLVIGPEGIIVVDTGRSSADGEAILEWCGRLSSLPIVAVVYSHSHYVFGTGPIREAYPEISVYAHYKVPRNIAGSFSGVRRFMRRRAAMESARYLPAEGPDADSAGSRIFTPGAMAYVPPTVLVAEDGAQHRIAGLPIVFHTKYPMDTNDTLFLWLPHQQAIIHNHFASNFPNIYPIQGGRYRDPLPWLAGLDLMRSYRPRHILSTHGAPDSGEERCLERLTAVRDGLQFVHDQTVRGMNRHLTPDELVDFVALPPSLKDHPDLLQTYGMVTNHVRGVFSGLAGWYDGNPATIDPPDPVTEARRIVEGFGGKGPALARLDAALQEPDGRWAARLGDWLVRAFPDDRDVRSRQAAALRRLGQHSTAWTVRNYYLSAARTLEGAVQITEPETSVDAAAAMHTPEGTFIRALGYRIDPARCPVRPTSIAVRFRDTGYEAGLILRRGVAEFVPTTLSDADIRITCPRETWIRAVDSLAPFSSLLDEEVVVALPSKDVARAVLGAFDG